MGAVANIGNSNVTSNKADEGRIHIIQEYAHNITRSPSREEMLKVHILYSGMP